MHRWADMVYVGDMMAVCLLRVLGGVNKRDEGVKKQRDGRLMSSRLEGRSDVAGCQSMNQRLWTDCKSWGCCCWEIV